MPQGDKSKYTDKQKRMAQHIEDGYKDKGVPEEEAEARAWATVNATDGGGKKPGGSGWGKTRNPEPTKTGAKQGGAAATGKKSTAKKSAKSSKKTTKPESAGARRKRG